MQAGYKVTLLDIAPNALQYTHENLKELNLLEGVEESILGRIEDLDQKYGPFKAVVGMLTFSFIPPHLFEEIMKTNVLGRIEPEVYFAGGFFGEEHEWAKNPNLTIMTTEKVKIFFESQGFTICENKEIKKYQKLQVA